MGRVLTTAFGTMDIISYYFNLNRNLKKGEMGGPISESFFIFIFFLKKKSTQREERK